jgi:alkanesulfonate monooxygenase SsuD/methylene tetrahydromethanopterin reductase-like flavin-dependent oxidoreductase (luciferase family)
LRSFALISNLYQSLPIFTNSRLINPCQKILMPIVLAGSNDGRNLAGRFQNGCSTALPPQPQQQQAAQQQQSSQQASSSLIIVGLIAAEFWPLVAAAAARQCFRCRSNLEQAAQHQRQRANNA